MKKGFIISISIIAILTLASIARAYSPWVDFEAYSEGIEEIGTPYQIGDIPVVEADTVGDVTFYFPNMEEPVAIIEGTFELHSIAFFVNGLGDPDSAVIIARIWIRDANSDGSFFCRARGIGRFGKLWTAKASGRWKNQNIFGEYEILGDPDGEGPLNFSSILNGKWKNPDLSKAPKVN